MIVDFQWDFLQGKAGDLSSLMFDNISPIFYKLRGLLGLNV